MGLRATVGVVLGVLSALCAVGGLFVFEGISIELPGIILGALGYYFGLRTGNRAEQILAIVAVILNVISILVSGLSGPPQ